MILLLIRSHCHFLLAATRRTDQTPAVSQLVVWLARRDKVRSANRMESKSELTYCVREVRGVLLWLCKMEKGLERRDDGKGVWK